MKPNLINPNTSKIVSYEYNHCTLFENMTEGMQRANHNAFWLVLKDDKKTVLQISKTMHQSRSCYVCEEMQGTYMSPRSIARAYDEWRGGMIPTFASLDYLNEQPIEQKGEN